MAALLHDHPRHHPALAEPVARFFALEPAIDDPPERPVLRVIPGGREAVLRRRLPEHVYRARRRAVAGAGLALLVVVVALVSVRTLPTPGTETGATVEAPAAVEAPVTPVPSGSYVVQPGDTLWSIAESLAPSGDVRPIVDELAERAGPGPLQAGARIDLAGLSG